MQGLAFWLGERQADVQSAFSRLASMSLTPGTRLGPYEITALAGAGGMGEVYRARDTRLDRVVAVKVLREAETAGAALKQRFDQEARVVASLSHPHICALYDVGHAGGIDFLVMEYLEGQTLAERLSGQTTRPSNGTPRVDGRHSSGTTRKKSPSSTARLSPEDTLRIATELASALVAAHGAGVIHGDLKPGNIMLTAAGVKVLDFGLAKLRPPADGPLASTRVASVDSVAGMLVGTLPYMAPEHLSEGTVDARTDLFAFGAIVYEMATGRRAFAGTSHASVMAAILDKDPEPISASEPLTPTALERLVRKCLAKDPAKRWQTASDMADELRWLGGRPASVEGARSTGRTWWRRRVLAAVIVVTVVAGAAVLWWMRGRWVAPAAQVPQFTQGTYDGTLVNAALSPDGRSVAYATGLPGREVRVFVQDLGGGQPLQVWTGPFAADLEWIPSGSHILVGGFKGAWLFSRFGGAARRVATTDAAYVALSPDGSKLAHASQGIGGNFRVSELDGSATLSVRVEGVALVLGLDWNATTNRIVLIGQDQEYKNGVWSVRPDGTDLRRLHTDPLELLALCSSPVAGTVYVLHGREGAADELLKFSLEETRQGHGPMVLERGLNGLGGGCSVSEDGRRLLFLRGVKFANLWRMNTTLPGSPAVALTRGTALYGLPSISPDDRWVLATQGNLSQGYRLVKIPLAGGGPVTLGEGCCGKFSPDGRRIAFISPQHEKENIHISDTDRLNAVAVPDSPRTHPVWLADGRLAWQVPGGRNFNIRDLVSGRDELLAKPPVDGWLTSAYFSPALDNVAVHWNRTERDEDRRNSVQLWVLSWPSRDARFVAEGIVPFGWSRDGRWIYASEPGGAQIVRVSPSSSRVEPVGQLPRGSQPFDECSVSANEESIVCAMQEHTADAWTIDNFDPDVPGVL